MSETPTQTSRDNDLITPNHEAPMGGGKPTDEPVKSGMIDSLASFYFLPTFYFGCLVGVVLYYKTYFHAVVFYLTSY